MLLYSEQLLGSGHTVSEGGCMCTDSGLCLSYENNKDRRTCLVI